MSWFDTLKVLAGRLLCERGYHRFKWASDHTEVEAPNGQIWYRDKYHCARCGEETWGQIVASRRG